MFYNLLEDGNGDDLALHAAQPVHSGEKWLANFWIWDVPSDSEHRTGAHSARHAAADASEGASQTEEKGDEKEL